MDSLFDFCGGILQEHIDMPTFKEFLYVIKSCVLEDEYKNEKYKHTIINSRYEDYKIKKENGSFEPIPTSNVLELPNKDYYQKNVKSYISNVLNYKNFVHDSEFFFEECLNLKCNNGMYYLANLNGRSVYAKKVTDKTSFVKEVELLDLFSYCNGFPKMIGVCTSRSTMFFENFGVSLTNFLNDGNLSNTLFLDIFSQMVKIVKKIMELGYTHGHLVSDNFVVDLNTYKVHLINFNHTEPIPHTKLQKEAYVYPFYVLLLEECTPVVTNDIFLGLETPTEKSEVYTLAALYCSSYFIVKRNQLVQHYGVDKLEYILANEKKASILKLDDKFSSKPSLLKKVKKTVNMKKIKNSSIRRKLKFEEL